MPKSFLKHFSFLGLLFAAFAASFTLAARDLRFLYGVLAGSAWTWLNFYFLLRLLEISLTGAPGRKKNGLMLLTMLKFPVLYLAGFFLLRSKFCSLTGLLAGLSAFFAAFLILWVRMNFGRGLEGRAS